MKYVLRVSLHQIFSGKKGEKKKDTKFVSGLKRLSLAFSVLKISLSSLLRICVTMSPTHETLCID